MAGVEVRRRLLGGDDGDIGWKRRVQRFGRPLRRRSTIDVQACHIAERVNSGVRAACDGELAPGRERPAERLAQGRLYRPLTGLGRPAAEARPAVLEREPQPHVGECRRIIGAMLGDEWRVDVELDDERHGYSLGERLRSLDLDDEARKRLGRRVIVTRDGSRVFLYAKTESEAKEAERVVRDLAREEGLSAQIASFRWHPVEEAWKDASEPLPTTEEERRQELREREARELREAEEEGSYDWLVNVTGLDRTQSGDLEERLRKDGHSVERLWTHLTVGALTEENANELASRLSRELPEEAEVWVQANLDDVPSPPFVLLGSWF
jgi:hypothetical protein